jgi:DnaJ-class molecular chaperone
MASSKKVKKVYVCPTCKGNGYVKVACIYEKEDMVHQCWDCESQGELYDYGEEDFSDFEGEGMSIH